MGYRELVSMANKIGGENGVGMAGIMGVAWAIVRVRKRDRPFG